MPNFKGTRLMPGQKWSKQWPGMIECAGNVVREPFLYRGKITNRYYKETTCDNCSKKMLANISNYKRSKNSFCSSKCKYEYAKQVNAGNRILKKRPNGDHHVLVKDWSHARSDRHGYVYEHLLVSEKKLGRKILKGEVVHHINCLKSDNRPENLFVCKNSKEHFLIHGSLNQCVVNLMSMGVLVFDASAKKYKVKK